MSPDELIRRLHEVIDTALSDSLTVENDRAVGRAEVEACEAERREAEAVRDEVTAALRHQRQVLREVTEHWRGHIDTHSESCWKWHAACLARVLRDMEER